MGRIKERSFILAGICMYLPINSFTIINKRGSPMVLHQRQFICGWWPIFLKVELEGKAINRTGITLHKLGYL